MRFAIIQIVLASLLAVILLIGCDDHGLSPLETPVITGQVHFAGSMPEHIQYCFVVVALDRPPGDALDLSYLGNYYEVPDSVLPTIADTTIEFQVYIGRGTYNWVFVAAIGNEDSVSISNVIGEYIAEGDTIPTSVTIEWDDSLWIEIDADLTTAQIP